MEKKLFIALVTASNNTQAQALQEFVARNTEVYDFHLVPQMDINRHRDVIVFVGNDYDYRKLRNQLIKRAYFCTHRAGKRTYVTNGTDVKVMDMEYITAMDEKLNDQVVTATINQNLADIRKETASWLREAFKIGYPRFDCNNPTAWKLALDTMNGQLQDTGYDFYSAGTEIAVEKNHVFTCTDDHNEYLDRGQTSVHTEERIKYQYTTISALETIRNWVQLQYYKMYELPVDREDIPEDLLSDVNPEWVGADDDGRLVFDCDNE